MKIAKEGKEMKQTSMYDYIATRGDRWMKRIYIGLPGLVIIAIGAAIVITLLSGG